LYFRAFEGGSFYFLSFSAFFLGVLGVLAVRLVFDASPGDLKPGIVRPREVWYLSGGWILKP
jgi:hypothetical protein